MKPFPCCVPKAFHELLGDEDFGVFADGSSRRRNQGAFRPRRREIPAGSPRPRYGGVSGMLQDLLLSGAHRTFLRRAGLRTILCIALINLGSRERCVNRKIAKKSRPRGILERSGSADMVAAA